MDGKVNEYYKCPTCVYLVKLHDESRCCESLTYPISLTSKQQCRKCEKWSGYQFDRFYHFELNETIKDKLSRKQVEEIWLDGRNCGRNEFINSDKLGRCS